MTSLEVTEFAMELGKGKANMHPSFGGIQFCSVGMVAVSQSNILIILYGKPFLRAAKNFTIL